MPCFKPIVAGSFSVMLAVSAAAASGKPTALLPKVEQECTSCHIAYRPNFLPKSSWQKVMGSLDQHFGTDASLPEADRAEIANWLDSVALEVGEAPPENRPTKSFWFTHQHNAKKIPPEVWQRASVKSPANCEACHADAAKGDFNEHQVHIPN